MDKKGMSYPLTVALVLALLIALCVLAEFFRLSIIAYGGTECLAGIRYIRGDHQL